MPERERRTFERVDAGFPAALVGVDRTGARRNVAAVIVDISVGGMRLCAEDAVATGEQVRVTFRLPDDHPQIETSLEVLACEATAAGEFTVRGKFTNITPETALRIARWTLAETRRAIR